MHWFKDSQLYKKLGASLVAISLIVGSLNYSALADEIQDLVGADVLKTVSADENATMPGVSADTLTVTDNIPSGNSESVDNNAATEGLDTTDNLGQNQPINVNDENNNVAEAEAAIALEGVNKTVNEQASNVKDIAFEKSVTVDGVVITVTAGAGVFPEGATIEARKVSLSEEKEVEEAIDEVRSEKKNVAVSYTFDITVYDKDGNEIEPDTEKGSVKVTFKMAEIANENLETEVYHVEETDEGLSAEGLDVEKVSAEAENRSADGAETSKEPCDEVTVETDGFSYYTVEFTYGGLQYVLEGDEKVELTTILDAVGIKENGEISKVEGSNDELFKSVFEEDIWYIKAVKAFSSEEWLKVTIDGIEYEIVVTDANDTHTHDNITFAAWSGTTALPSSAGNYYLTQDVTLSSVWSVPTGGAVNLCLNGHAIKCNMTTKMISVPSNATLNLYDCGTAVTKFARTSDDYNGYWIPSASGDKTVTGGYILGASNFDEGSSGIVKVNSGTFNMYGGTIVGNKNKNGSWSVGGVWIEQGTFNMYGGAIKGCNGREGSIETSGNNATCVTISGDAVIENCTSFNCAGGLFLRDYTTFTMNGGTIKDCIAKGHTGGILVKGANAKAYFYGGKIINNKAGEICGGVRSENNASITLGGDVQISGNTVGAAANNFFIDNNNPVYIGTGLNAPRSGMSVGVNAATQPTVTAPTNVTRGGGTDYSGFFTSDYAAYAIKNDGNVVKLMVPGTITNGTPIDSKESNNGYIKIDKSSAYKGDIVTVTVYPDDEYSIKSVKYNGTDIEQDSAGKYCFSMPSANVTVNAEFVAETRTIHYENGIYNGFTPYWQVGNAPADGTLTYGSQMTLPASTSFSNVGYTLAGWTTTKPTSSSSSKEYNAGATLTVAQVNELYNKCINGEITLYAVWQRDTTKVAWNKDKNAFYTDLKVAIEELGNNNTLFILNDVSFSSDNGGGVQIRVSNATIDGGKYSATVDGIAVTRGSLCGAVGIEDSRFTVTRSYAGDCSGHMLGIGKNVTDGHIFFNNIHFNTSNKNGNHKGFFCSYAKAIVDFNNVMVTDFNGGNSDSGSPMLRGDDASSGHVTTYKFTDCQIEGNVAQKALIVAGDFTSSSINCATCYLDFYGNTTIKGNNNNSGQHNVEVHGEKYIKIGENFTGEIGVYLPGATAGMVAAVCDFNGDGVADDNERAKAAGLVAGTSGKITSDQGYKLVAVDNTVRVAKSATLTFNGNGGSGNPPASAKVDGVDTEIVNGVLSAYHGAKVVLPPAGTFTKTGHAFDCWNTKADGAGTGYAAGAEYTVNADSATLYAKWKHGHEFTFNVDSSAPHVLKAYCKEGCPEGLDANPISLTLTAPSNSTYDGNAKTVTFASGEDTTWTDAGLELLPVKYATQVDPSTPLTGAPKNAGEYIASISKDGKTATLSFEIKKAASTISTHPTAKENLIYTGSAQELINAGVTSDGTIEYSLFEGDNYSTSIPKGTDAIEYTVYYKVIPDDNHEPCGPFSIKATIAESDVYDITPPTASYVYGEKLSEHIPSGGTAKVGETVLIGTFDWADSVKDTVPSVSDSNITEYEVIFTPSSSGYKAKSCQAKVTVAARDARDVKADVEFEPGSGTGTDYTITETLTDSKGNILHKDGSNPDYEGPTVNKNDTEKTIEYTVTYVLKGNYTGTIEKKFSINKPKQDDPGLNDKDKIVTRVDKENEAVEAFKPELSLDAKNVKTIIAEDIESKSGATTDEKEAAEKLKENSQDVICKANMYITVEKKEDSAVAEEQKDRIENKLTSQGVKNLDSTAVYLDISMYTKYTITKPSGEAIVTSPEKKITNTGDVEEVVTIQVPNELRNSNGNIIRTYYVVRDHISDTSQETDILAKTTNTTITFKTNKFSIYALRYSDSKKPSGGGDDPGDGGSTSSQNANNMLMSPPVAVTPAGLGYMSPKTGDSNEIYLYVAILAIGILLVVAGGRKKSFKSKE